MQVFEKKQTFKTMFDFNQYPLFDMAKVNLPSKPKSNAKATIITVSICMFVAIMAIYDENSSGEISRKPYILAGIPSSFDLRVLPSYKTADFTSTEQGICVGGNFAKTISQAASNYYSAHYQKKVRLSAQELLDCSAPSNQDICHYTTQAQIDYALSYIQSTGLATNDCYPFRPLDGPGTCSRVCPSDNSTIQIRYKVSASPVFRDVTHITNWLGNNGPLIVVIQKHDGFNYYSGGILKNEGSSYGLVTLQVVGWKEKGNILMCRSTFGQTWGINGYVQISLNEKSIKGFYGFSIPSSLEI